MQKYWIIFVWLVAPSMQVIMTPCQVKNIETQPHYATSLPRKALVQVVQIPPVFTQKVLVGRCVNATSEISGAPGNYFVCKQRYSSVELYIMENSSVPGITQFYNPNSTIHGILERFKQGHFVREFVVVESGCDFTFNLLPLLLQQQNNQQPQQATPSAYPPINPQTGQTPLHEEHHRFHFLPSPYHSTQRQQKQPPQQYATPPMASNQLANSQYATHSSSYNNIIQGGQPPLPSTSPNISNIPPVYSSLYSSFQAQGGNANNNNDGVDRSGGNIFNNNNHQHPGVSTHNNNYVNSVSAPTPSSFYQPRGSYGGNGGQDSSTGDNGVQGRGKVGHHHIAAHHHAAAHTHTHTTETAEESAILQEVKTTASEYEQSEPDEQQPELYRVSDKIGVPLYILSPQIDPLLKNIESVDNTHHNSAN